MSKCRPASHRACRAVHPPPVCSKVMGSPAASRAAISAGVGGGTHRHHVGKTRRHHRVPSLLGVPGAPHRVAHPADPVSPRSASPPPVGCLLCGACADSRVAGDAAGDGRYLRRGPGSPHRRGGLGGGCLALLGCGVLRLPAGQCCPPPLSVTFQAAHHLIPTGVPGCHGVPPVPCSAWRTSLSGTDR